MKLKDLFESGFDPNPTFDSNTDPDFEEWYPEAVALLRKRGLLGDSDEVSGELYEQMRQACDEGEAVEDFVESIDSQRAPAGPWGEPTETIPDEEEGIPMRNMSDLDKLMRGESFVREASGERASSQSSSKSRDSRRSQGGVLGKPTIPPDVDDFGDEPSDEDGFTVKDTSYLTGGGNPERGAFDKKGGFHAGEEGEEFNGAPADPEMGFGGVPDDSTFGDDPVFGDIPQPSADPEDDLWHGAPPWDADETGVSGGQHHTNVTFPDYEGPEAKNSWSPGGWDKEPKPDEKGFYPRSKSSKKKRSDFGRRR